jgi:hypothetical protein
MGSPDELKKSLPEKDDMQISLEDVFVSLIEDYNLKADNRETAKN